MTTTPSAYALLRRDTPSPAKGTFVRLTSTNHYKYPGLCRDDENEMNINNYQKDMKIFGVAAAVGAAMMAFATTLNHPADFITTTPSGFAVHPFASEGDLKKEPNKWGEFLIGLQAIRHNDFETMKKFSIKSTDPAVPAIVRAAAKRAAFLSGAPIDPQLNESGEKGLPRLCMDIVSAAQSGNWKIVWRILKPNEFFLITPARIVAAIAAGDAPAAIKIAEKEKTKDLKNFQLGFAHAISGNPKNARDHFNKLSPDFLNVSDYLFIRAFYLHNKMAKDAEKLSAKFRNSPRGSFIADIQTLPDWSNYDTRAKQVRFGLVSVVSHNPMLTGTAWGMLILRTADGADVGGNDDALNYYLGLSFRDASTREKFFAKIPESSPFFPFVMVRRSDDAKGIRELEKLVKKYPAFAPAAARLSLLHIADGDFKRALRVADNAIGALSDATNITTAYLLKLRAHINYLSGEFAAAETDLGKAIGLSPDDSGLVADIIRVYAAMGKNADQAYDLAMDLIKTAPSESDNWDAMATILMTRGEWTEAVRIYQRVRRVDPGNSGYAARAGDALAGAGQINLAKDAYKAALELKGDGHINAREVRRKMNRLR
ncbi:MAG: hypothetical protein LBB23_01110 [Rickettsiales bacterium]|nr:hypothetical protein [Rickettsiales bacterium]